MTLPTYPCSVAACAADQALAERPPLWAVQSGVFRVVLFLSVLFVRKKMLVVSHQTDFLAHLLAPAPTPRSGPKSLVEKAVTGALGEPCVYVSEM